jgi:16S rRNA G966 N2-methylase RsmD
LTAIVEQLSDDEEICMFEMRHENGDLYPIHILGNGPSMTQQGDTQEGEVYETIICTFLGDYTPYEVERSCMNLYKVNSDRVGQTRHILDVYNLEEYDDLYRPQGVESRYWDQRYRYFSKFDHGICLDLESWYSLTPAIISSYIGEKLSSIFSNTPQANELVVIDGFCGCGTIALVLAEFNCIQRIYCFDNDKHKIAFAKHNASIYQNEAKIEFYVDDMYQVFNNSSSSVFLPKTIDAIILSPPWGGSDYLSVEYYDLFFHIPKLLTLIEDAKNISQNIIISVPRNCSKSAITEALSDCLPKNWGISMEDIQIHSKIKLMLIYISKIATAKTA